jgi:hypothetical protein
MGSFQAGNITAIRSERVVCVAKTDTVRAKVFQVFFGTDGSLFVSFPYFRHRIGLLSSATIPATGTRQVQVNLEQGGKVTSHLVKYSHHTDGRAHFSQTGKIVTAVKRQSIALDKQYGHIFTLLVQGLDAFDKAHPVKDVGTNPKRAVIDFEVKPSETIKFIGRWFDVNQVRLNQPMRTIGPVIPTVDDEGIWREACLVASPFNNARHVLAITRDHIPSLGPEPEVFMFQGGFDPREVMTDPNKESGFLSFRYPLPNADIVKGRIGSVDFVPKMPKI